MRAKGVTTKTALRERVAETIREVMNHDGYRDRLPAFADTATFAKSLDRSVLGSMNDLVFGAKLMLADNLSLLETSLRLNETPLKILKYENPREVFVQLLAGAAE